LSAIIIIALAMTNRVRTYAVCGDRGGVDHLATPRQHHAHARRDRAEVKSGGAASAARYTRRVVVAERVDVIGVTSWGLVLARLFADAGSSVILLARSEGEAEIVRVQRTHPERLREIRLPSSVDL
jgi:hypothetical protein